MFLLRISQAFQQANIPYALVGGYAVALHGAVRGTIDVDIITKGLEDIKALEALNR